MSKNQEMKALLMKVQVTFDSATQYVNFDKHSTYEVARKIIDLIEDNNGKKLDVKKKLTLIKGG